MMTYFENPIHVKETWHLVNAEGKTLGVRVETGRSRGHCQ